MHKRPIILAISILVLSSNFQAVSAEIFFPSTNVRLGNPGTYCITAPSNSISENKNAEWVRLTEKALSDWEQNLMEAELENDNIWQFNVKETSEEREDECDVTIEFKDKPNLSDTVGGYFSWPPGKIVVYYLQPKLCNSVIPCYDDKTLKSDDTVYAIIIHEIGHSLGLDHYVSDDNTVNKKWQLGNKSPPSVMIPTIPRNPTILQITDIDVQKVREIYGTEGFYAFSNSIIPTSDPKSEPVIPLSPISTLSISQKIIEANKYDKQIITLSGKIFQDELHRGLPVIITIHRPDNSVEVLKIYTTKIGHFETLLIFNDKSIRGTYHVSASYLEQVDKNTDITFEVIDRQFDSPKPELKQSPQILDNSHTQKDPDQNSGEIPDWVRNNAEWWASEQIGDHAFVSSIQFLIEEKIISISDPQKTSFQNFKEMPLWVKNIAGFWAAETISDGEFIRSIQYLVENKIIVIP